MTIDDILNKYSKHFDENFPIFAIPTEITSEEKKLEEFVNKCIQENKLATEFYPYKDGNLY